MVGKVRNHYYSKDTHRRDSIMCFYTPRVFLVKWSRWEKARE